MRAIKAILLAALAALASCAAPGDDWSAFSEIPEEGWRYGSTMVYMPVIPDSVARGELQLAVRHTNDYPWRNLWVEVSSQRVLPNGHLALVADTVNVELADVYGNWLGSGLGTSFQHVVTVNPDFTLFSGAPLRVRHIMRADRVEHLEQIGLIFKHNE